MKGERTTRLLSCFVGGVPATKGSYRPVTNRASGKTLLDALTDSRLIKDDSRIVSLDTTKRYAARAEEIGVALTVRTIHTKDTKEPS